jgi:hypothetical protein
MNVYNLLPVFKVVEINNAVGIRSGHIIAQAPLRKINYLATNASPGTGDGAQAYVENGSILYLDVDGELKSPIRVNAAIRKAQKPILHFTEELFTTGLSEELRHYALEFNDENIAYPRGLVLHVGDAFTTNNFVGTLSGATVGVVNGSGQIAIYANYAAAVTALTTGDATYDGPLFHVEESTLPDGETPAVELTVLAEVVSIA